MDDRPTLRGVGFFVRAAKSRPEGRLFVTGSEARARSGC